MRRVFSLLVLVVLLVGVYWFFFRKKSDPRQQPLRVGKHSQDFNQRVNNALLSYFDLTNSFVEADTIGAKSNAIKLSSKLDSLKLDELKKDTVGIVQSAQAQIGDMKSNITALLMEKDITEMRKDFKMVSEALYPFLKTINYEGPVLYWQNCGMPFGENTSANWISNKLEIVNPYLGKNHPQWKSAMLHCGDTQDSIWTK